MKSKINNSIITKMSWIVSIMVILLFFYSCRQEEQEVLMFEPDISKVPKDIEGQFEYARQHLTTIGIAALQLGGYQNVKQTVHNEVEKQFDGDYNVLFEDLLSKTINKDSNSSSRIASILSDEDYSAVLAALDAFKGINGEDFYPQIYIPYFETLEEKGESATSFLSESEADPIIVVYDGDETKTEWTGYRLNDLGELEDVGFPITVDFAENNLVWVISINERMGSEIIDPDYGGIYTNARVDGIAQRVKFNNITVHCRKESGLSGKTDLSIIRLTTFYDASEWYCHGECTDLGNISRTGTVFKQWSKDEIGDQKEVNWLFWNKDSDYGDYMCFLLFEKDGFPAGTIRTKLFHPTGSIYSTGATQIEYRSSDRAYAYVNMSYENGQSTFTRDFGLQSLGYVYDRCIEFNTQFD